MSHMGVCCECWMFRKDCCEAIMCDAHRDERLWCAISLDFLYVIPINTTQQIRIVICNTRSMHTNPVRAVQDDVTQGEVGTAQHGEKVTSQNDAVVSLSLLCMQSMHALIVAVTITVAAVGGVM